MKRASFLILAIIFFAASLLLARVVFSADSTATLKITFEWSTSPPDDRVTGYSIYESNVSGDTTKPDQWHKINADLIPAPPYEYTITGAVREDRWWYCIAEGENGLKSPPSAPIKWFVNTIPPGTVEGLTITKKSVTLDFGE